MATHQNNIVHLPSELVSAILQSVDNPRDLLSLISSSTRINKVFKESRNSIVSSVLQNAFTSHFPEAVAACRAKQIQEWGLTWSGLSDNPATDESSPVDKLTQRTDEFLTSHFSSRNITSQTLREEPSLLNSLCRLWFLTDHFVSVCAKTTLQEFGNCFSSGPVKIDRASLPDPTISQAEYIRIQRGLVHFELYRRVFASAHKNAFHVAPAQQAKLFFKYFSDYEKEEMWAVYEILMSYVEDVYNTMETEFTEFAKQHSEKQAMPEMTRRASESILPETASSPGDLEDSPFYLFARRHRHANGGPDFLRLPLLGLPCLKQLRESKQPYQTLFNISFGSSTKYARTATIYFEDVMLTSVTDNVDDAESVEEPELHGQTRCCDASPNSVAWRWVTQGERADAETPSSRFNPRHGLLVQSGYIFWDDVRWAETGVTEADIEMVACRRYGKRRQALNALRRRGQTAVRTTLLQQDFKFVYDRWSKASQEDFQEFTAQHWDLAEY